MSNAARFLITTADERTWKFDRPVLFLGEWCRLYDRKHIWGNMDAIVAEPLGLDPEQKVKDIDYVQRLSAELLIELSDALNGFHKTNYSTRYWNILLGHWLQRYVAVSFNRYYALKQALEKNEITGTVSFDSTSYRLATLNSMSFISASNDGVWNNVFYNRVIQHLYQSKIELNSIRLNNEAAFIQHKGIVSKKMSSKGLIKSLAYLVLPKLSGNKDAFIINSYLPKWQEIKLQLALLQVPQLWQSPPLISVQFDLEVRKNLKFPCKDKLDFEIFVRDLLPELIPTSYLEGYAQLNKQVKCLPWPSRPKFIFTSNNFDTDEIFKAWVAVKVEEGVPYFTGQHGNNYGTHIYSGNPAWPDQTASDKFFTWGWSNCSKKNIPAFVFKIANKPAKVNSNGGLLLIEVCLPHQLSPSDTHYEFGIYQEQQFRFVNALPESIRKSLTVRLHSGWRNTSWSDDKRWIENTHSVNLELGGAPIQKLIAKSRLVVHSYDSTGILEGLASNIPTLCFWNGGFDHLLPSAKPYYELLLSAGIIANSPEHAAQLVKQHWDDVDGWWNSEQVQSARRLFCEQYARVDKNPISTMKQLLMEAVASHKNNELLSC